MENQENKSDQNEKRDITWLITAIIFIIICIILLCACGYLGYKLYSCKKRPNAVVYIE